MKNRCWKCNLINIDKNNSVVMNFKSRKFKIFFHGSCFENLTPEELKDLKYLSYYAKSHCAYFDTTRIKCEVVDDFPRCKTCCIESNGDLNLSTVPS